MPLTPLHYPIAYGISKERRFAFPGLIVGSVIPDIEVPLMWILFPNLPDHLFLHSFIGALTIGTLLAVLVTRFIYAPIMPRIFNIDQDEMNNECKITSTLFFSCFIGALLHLLIDYPMHPYNPHFWPFLDPYAFVGTLVLFFMNFGFNINIAYLITNSIFHFTFIVLFFAIYWINRKNPQKWNIMWLKGDIARNESQIQR